jgi:hypothetical protein
MGAGNPKSLALYIFPRTMALRIIPGPSEHTIWYVVQLGEGEANAGSLYLRLSN